MTSRERVRRCLEFDHPDHIPYGWYALPWAQDRYGALIEELQRRFPSDFGGPGQVYRAPHRWEGNPYRLGRHLDEWGCVWHNIQDGVHGEICDPIVKDLAEWRRIVQPPYEMLEMDGSAARDQVSRACDGSDRFMTAGCNPRPWERYQFLRGSAEALMDVMDPGPAVRGLLRRIHEYHLKELEFWVSTDVDAVSFMDDWGAQRQLLIPPAIWRDLFKPLYRDYCELAHAHGKFAFMHSDGFITEIYGDLVEVGVDALNSQLFCMDMDDLSRRFKGRITFNGEIDRQHVLASPDPQAGRDAVRKVAELFCDPAGGVIAQFEFGPGAVPETIRAVLEEWEAVSRTISR